MSKRKSCIQDTTQLRVGKLIFTGNAEFIRKTKAEYKAKGIMPVEVCPPARAKQFGKI